MLRVRLPEPWKTECGQHSDHPVIFDIFWSELSVSVTHRSTTVTVVRCVPIPLFFSPQTTRCVSSHRKNVWRYTDSPRRDPDWSPSWVLKFPVSRVLKESQVVSLSKRTSRTVKISLQTARSPCQVKTWSSWSRRLRESLRVGTEVPGTRFIQSDQPTDWPLLHQDHT